MSLGRPRYEFKYLCPLDQAREFKERLLEVMEPDPHAEDGTYQVHSIYYDTHDLQAYYEKLDGVDHRYKIRLRGYGQLAGLEDLEGLTLFLEAKHRQDQRVHKDRVRLDGSQLPEFLSASSLFGNWLGPRQEPGARVLEDLLAQNAVLPQVWLSYTRAPLVSRLDPTLRATFDTNLRVRGSGARLEGMSEGGSLFLPPDLCVVELKFHWAMPVWLVELCCASGLRLRRYSKYCSALERLRPDIARREVSVVPSISQR